MRVSIRRTMELDSFISDELFQVNKAIFYECHQIE